MNAQSSRVHIVLAIGLVLVLAGAGVLFTRGDAMDSGKSTVEIRKAAPEFTIGLSKGGDFRLGDHKGKPIVINFFASWCLPCRNEAPILEKISHEYGTKGVVFLGIAVDDTEEKMEEFLIRHGITFPVGLDKTTAIQKSFGLSGIPTTCFISRQGTISYLHPGVVTEELMKHELDRLL